MILKMENKSYTIDLDKYRTSNRKAKSRVFTGRDRGEDVRENSHIDDFFDMFDKIIIKIPNDIFSITPSFLEEFLLHVVKKHSKEECLRKLEFVGEYDIHQALEEAIERILQDKTGLEK